MYLEQSDNPNRSTAYDLVAVEKGNRMVNIDSQAPNKVVEEWLWTRQLFPDLVLVRPETTYGKSRFDFYIESASGRKAFLEVKGVTLLQDGVARFPDAPTTRGVKHIGELVKCLEDGYEAYILFLLEMKGSKWMEPNDATHPAFGQVLREAAKTGVKVLAYDCIVTPESLEVDKKVEVRL